MARVTYATFLLIITFFVISGFDTSSAADKPCPGKHFNLIFVIDSSGSIGDEYYPENFVFVRNFLSDYEIGDDKTKAALITYGSGARLIFNLTGDKATIDKKLQKVPYQNSTTQTGKALRFVVEKKLAGAPRTGVATIVILVTDGKSSDESDTLLAADLVKGEGYMIVCVGVGPKVKWSEMETVATDPAYVFKANDYTQLGNIAQQVSKAACEGSPKPPTPEPEPTTQPPEPTTPPPEPTTPPPEPTTPPPEPTTPPPEPTTPPPEPTTPPPEPTTPPPEPTTPPPEPTTGESKPTPNKPCPGKFFNLIFVIDSSGSIGAKLYPENFKFVKNLLSAFEIGDFKTKVALITFGSNPRLIFNLTGDETLINKRLENIPEYQNSKTQTGKALRYVVTKRLAGEPRPDVDTIVFLVTDGKSDNYTDTIDAARLVRSQGFAVVAIGVGDRKINWEELKQVATRPEYVIKIDNYEVLTNYADSISQETCNIIPPEPIPTTTPEPGTTTPEPTTQEPTTNKPCPGKFFNLIFVIDSSGSIGDALYPENFKFVKNFLSAFEIGDFKTKVALITFGSNPRLIFNLTGDATLINKHLENIPEYQNSTTQTGIALRYVVAKGLAGEPRPDVDTIVFLVTDGKSENYTDTIDAARLVRSQGFAVVAIGIGDRKINWEELKQVATRPEYVIKIDNYEVLKNYAESISHETCNIIPPEPIPTTTPEPATTTLEQTTPEPTTPEPTTPEPTTPEPTTPEPTTPEPTTPEPTTPEQTTPEPTTPEPTTPEPTTPTPCPDKYFNLVFVIDSSNSIGAANYPANFEFVKKFLARFEIGDDKTRAALITFGTHPRLIFNNTGNEKLIYKKLMKVEYQHSSTQTALALRYVIDKRLAGAPRAGVDTIVVLVTDGKSNNTIETQLAADALKDKGYTVICVGVGRKVNWNELNNVASKPEYVFKATDYSTLSRIADAVSKSACYNAIGSP